MIRPRNATTAARAGSPETGRGMETGIMRKTIRALRDVARKLGLPVAPNPVIVFRIPPSAR